MISGERFLTAALLFVVSAGIGCFRASVGREDDTIVFDGTSTKDALTDIAKDFAAAGKGKVVLSFGSGGDLARQIENRARAGIT